ncbi:MAG: hypothetical protein ABIT38_13045, partial [Gemmatimonadaceae bacterium]
MSSPKQKQARPRKSSSATRIVSRVASYLLAAWGLLITLALHFAPSLGAVTSLVAIYTTVPLLVFARWRGWPFYPRAWFRLLVVRPFWYTQLLLPLVSAGALSGVVLGAPFRRAIAGGQFAALLVFVVCAVLLVAGYVGANRLVVRKV